MTKKSTVKSAIKLKQALLRAKILKQAENKDSKQAVDAFFLGNVGTTSRGKTYYILGDKTSRFLMHKLTPIAQIYGTNIYLNAGFVSDNNTGVEIQKFLTDRKAKGKFRIIQVSEEALISELRTLPVSEIQKLKTLQKQYGPNPKIDAVLNSAQDDGYSSDEEMFRLAFKRVPSVIKATFYKKIEDILLKGASNPEEIIQAFSPLPEITITNQEESLLEKLNLVNSPYVHTVHDLVFKHSTRVVESYYDIAAHIMGSGVDFSNVNIQADYKKNIQPIISQAETPVYRSYIKKLSDASNQLMSNPALIEAYQKAGEYDFFTILSRLKNSKSITKDNSGGLLKNEGKSLMKSYISQLNIWTNQVFSLVKYKAITSAELAEKEQGFGVYFSRELKNQYELMNQALAKSIKTVFSDPEVQQEISKTALASQDIISTLVRTGGELEEDVNFNPKAPINELVKQFIAAAFKARGYGLGSNTREGNTEDYITKTRDDILKFQAFANSAINQELSKKIRSGYIWSGVFIDEYAPSSCRSGKDIEIPLGTIAYGASGGDADKQFSRKTILGNGQMLKVEIEDNFLRFSVHTYHATLTGQQRQTEVNRILERSVEMFRMHHEISKVLTATGVSEYVKSKVIKAKGSKDYEKELLAFFGDTKVPFNCFIANSGGTLSLSTMGTGDYFNAENVRSRGFTYYELKELYDKLVAGEQSEKFMDSLFQYEIKGCLEALSRYIDTCIENGKQKIQKLLENGEGDIRDMAWLTDKEFYRQNIIADLQYHVGDQGQFGTHAFYPLYDESGKDKSVVSKANRAFIVRNSVNPVFVNVSAIQGVDNIGNDILSNAQKNVKTYGKLLDEYNKSISSSGIKFEMEESGPTALPIMHQGPIITDLKTIIAHSRKRYVNPVGRTVTIPISDFLKGDLGDKYGGYFDADYHIQYHQDLATLLNLMEEIYKLNLSIADLLDLSKESFTLSTEGAQETTTFIEKFTEQLSLQLGVTLRTKVANQIGKGTLALKEIVSNIEAFTRSVSPVGNENDAISQEQILSKVPIEKIKETYVETVSGVLQGIYNDTLSLLDAAYDSKNLSSGTGEPNPTMQAFVEKMNQFESIRKQIRAKSKELMLILGKYAADKGMLVDMVKTGRVLNFLLSEAEKKKRSTERKEKKEQQEGEEDDTME